MTRLEQLCHDMQCMHAEVQSWQKVGDEYGINKALARLIANGYEPGKKVRAMLGLPDEVNVVVVYGEVKPGSQTLNSLLCDCGQWFIPNHPRRKRCFICSPFRKRKTTKQ